MDFLNSSDVDVAHYILTERKNSIFYKDLILEIIDKRQKNVQSMSAAISEIYTHINMDSRFYHEGGGRWGLTAWMPADSKRSTGRGSSTGKSAIESSTHKKKLESIQE